MRSDKRGRIAVPRDVNSAIGSNAEVLVILGFMIGVACDRKRPIEIERMVTPIRAKANAGSDGRDEISVLIVVDGEDVAVELFAKRKLGIEEKAADTRARGSSSGRVREVTVLPRRGSWAMAGADSKIKAAKTANRAYRTAVHEIPPDGTTEPSPASLQGGSRSPNHGAQP